MITVDDVVGWSAWAASGATPEEQQARALRVNEHVYPVGLDPAEVARRVEVVARARAVPEEEIEKREPCAPPSTSAGVVPETPNASSVVPVPFVPASSSGATTPPAARVHEGLIRRDSAAYKRGSKHDGTAAEVARMRARAKGDPFAATVRDAPPPKNADELVRSLRKIGTPPRAAKSSKSE